MSFDRIARIYAWGEHLTMGHALRECRFAFLDEMRNARHVLIFGEGDGRFLEAFLSVNPGATVECVEGSAAMIRTTTARLERRGLQPSKRVRFINLDAREWRGSGKQYDLVVALFFLDCLTTAEVGELVEKVRNSVTPDATWAISDFRLPDAGWARLRAQAWISSLYRAFGWLTGLRVRNLPEYERVLERAGLARRDERLTQHGMLTAQLWQLQPQAVFKPG